MTLEAVRHKIHHILVLTALLFTVCFGNHCTSPQKTGDTVGAVGGTVKSVDGKVTLLIPPGALKTETAITINKSNGTTSGGLVTPLVYQLGPDGLTFEKPVTVTWTLQVDDLPGQSGELQAHNLTLFTMSGGELELLSDMKTSVRSETGEMTLQASLSHFSELRLAIGRHDLLIEGPNVRSSKRLKGYRLEVGQVLPLNVTIRQRSTIPPEHTSTLRITGITFKELENSKGTGSPFRLLGIKKRGSGFADPYNDRIGNALTLTENSRGVRFPMKPGLLVECQKEGIGDIHMVAELLAGLKKDGKPLDTKDLTIDELLLSRFVSTANGVGGEVDMYIQVRCVAAKTPAPKPSSRTIDGTSLRRTKKGDIAVFGKAGVALHDGVTLTRRRIVNPGADVLIYEDSFGDEESFDLTVERDAEKGILGQIYPKVHLPDASTKPLSLDTKSTDLGLLLLRALCQFDKSTNTKCAPNNELVGVDSSFGLQHFFFDPKLLKIQTQTLTVKGLSAIEQISMGKQKDGKYQALAVERDTGKVFYLNGALLDLKVAPVGDTKSGKHILRCDPKLLSCTVGQFVDRNVHFFLKNDVNAPPTQTVTEQLKETFSNVDLYRKTDGTTSVLVTHPKKGSVRQLAFDKDGKLTSNDVYFVANCPTLKSAVFSVQSTSDYVALCADTTSDYLVGATFRESPKEAPPQEVNREPVDRQEIVSTDAGTPDIQTPDTGKDCSQYSYTEAGKTYPKWFAGHEDGTICKPMYDKVYGRNGQSITCKTDADCNNPCRHVCCRNFLFAEIVVCKQGVCTFEVSNKCSFCASGTGSESCGLPPNYTP